MEEEEQHLGFRVGWTSEDSDVLFDEELFDYRFSLAIPSPATIHFPEGPDLDKVNSPSIFHGMGEETPYPQWVKSSESLSNSEETSTKKAHEFSKVGSFGDKLRDLVLGFIHSSTIVDFDLDARLFAEYLDPTLAVVGKDPAPSTERAARSQR